MAKTKMPKALTAIIKAEQARQKADLVNLLESAPGEERAATRRAMIHRETVLAAMSPKRRNKHGNNVSYDQDGKWDSDAEKRRWPILKAMQKDGQITGLRRQVRIPLHANTYVRVVGGDSRKIEVGVYVADFVYAKHSMVPWTPKSGFTYDAVVEDVKGFRDAMFKWKARHFKIEYGFSIKEIKA